MNAVQIGQLGIGVELIQHREGNTVGRCLFHRPDEKVLGTPEALRSELLKALDLIHGPEGDMMREKMKTMSQAVREKRRSTWTENLKKFIEMTRA